MNNGIVTVFLLMLPNENIIVHCKFMLGQVC